MKSIDKIRIKRRTQPQWLIWVILFMPFLFGTFFDLLRLPSALKYILDIAWLLLVLYLVLKARVGGLLTKNIRGFYLWVAAFAVLTLCVCVCNYQSIFYYAWGFRNNFRFYVLFFAVAAFVKESEIEYYFDMLDKLFWVNAVVTLVQYVAFGKYGDWLGGLFGVSSGCNTYTNIFFVIVAAKTIVCYLNKLEDLRQCIAKCAMMLVIAALAELKFFYVEFILIAALAVLISDFSWRKLFIMFGGTVCIALSVYLLTLVFPQSAGFFNLATMIEIASSERGYTSAGDINRLTAIPIISDRFLKTFPQQLFGMGLGNCDTAGYSFLVTPFYKQYAYLNYHWFSIAFLFLETGFLGLAMYYGFFVLVIQQCVKGKKHTGKGRCYNHIAILVAVCCMLITVYNSTLRMDAGYMAYFILALPFVKTENTGKIDT